MRPIMQQPLVSMADCSCIGGYFARDGDPSGMFLCHKFKSRQTYGVPVKSEPVRGV